MSDVVKPDSLVALQFLKRWAPEGPWVLTSIQPDKKAMATRTFTPDTSAELNAFLDDYNGKRNIYFHVNPPTRELKKKAERTDIKSMDWLHVDIDPRVGEDLEEERARALALLTTRLPQGVPAPTAIVFSGGGYQGFWRLKNPFPIDGELVKAEDAKRWNQQLELLFGADNCHNIDRIMRLPGTVNIPDAKKAKKGRTPTLARVVEFNDNVYSLQQFTPAPGVQMAGDTGFSGQTVEVSGNIERIEDVAELDQWSVPDRTKVIIVQGNHPDETKPGDNSRSIWVFDAVCSLVRCEVPDDVIFSILTDPDFGISESVIEKGANAKKYAIRQIERAKEEVIDPALRELNEKHAVIGNVGGKCRVVEELYDENMGRAKLTYQSFDDLRNRYMNRRVQVGVNAQGLPQMVPLGKFWLDHPNRRQFSHIVFSPGRDAPGAYNLWKGFAVASRPGDCSLFLQHVQENICQNDPALYTYVMGWLARAVQQPASPGEVAIVMRGARGTGKSFFAKEVGKLFGRHFLQVSNSTHLVGQFNSHLRDVVFLFADEAFYAGDKKHTSILKTLITEDMLTIEAKGIDVEASPNYVHLIMASNDVHVIPAGGDERRFLVLDVGKGKMQDSGFFAQLSEQMANGGREALLYHLLTLDISGFQVRAVPKTDALHEQKLLSLTPEEEWWYQKLLEGRILKHHDEWVSDVRKEELIQDYVSNAERFRVSFRGNGTTLGRFLKRIVPRLGDAQKMAAWEETSGDGWVKKVSRRTYFWTFPTLEEARARWEELYGKEKWLEPQTELALPKRSGQSDTPF